VSPSDFAGVVGYLHDLDDDGAAREFCRVLRLDRDAEQALLWILAEARESTEWAVRYQYERAAMGMDDEEDAA